MSEAWRDLSGQRTIFGEVITVCDICGMASPDVPRHQTCQNRAGKAAEIVGKWLRQARRELRRGRVAKPDHEIRALAKIAGISLS